MLPAPIFPTGRVIQTQKWKSGQHKKRATGTRILCSSELLAA